MKNPPWKDNHGTDQYVSPLLKYCWPYKKSLTIVKLPPPQNSLPRQKIYRQKSTPTGGRRAGRIFAGKLSAGETFLGGGDPIMGHRR